MHDELKKERKPFTKDFVSWKGRAKAMEALLASNGFTVEYTPNSVVLTKYEPKGFVAKKPWWKFW